MVQPRPGSITLDESESMETSKKSKSDLAHRPMYLDAASVAFFLYVGWKISDHIPTNRLVETI